MGDNWRSCVVDSKTELLSLDVESFIERLSVSSSLNNVEEVELLNRLDEEESELVVSFCGELIRSI